MTRRRTVHVVTGTRAEFGLLRPVLRAIADHPRLTLQLTVTGTHLITGSWRDIAAAGFDASRRVAMQRRGEVGRRTDADALGRGVTGLTRRFADTEPTFVLVLGDRIEAFAAASAAAVMGIRVAHIHGGDRAEGVADESMRHAITKLAHLHFPATAASRRRLIRMGENPAVIFNHGSPAIDGLRDVAAAPASGGAPTLIVMQHPIGDDDEIEARRMADTLAATEHHHHHRCDASRGDRLVLMPNHDPGRDGIVRAIRDAGIDAVDHLPRDRFLSLLKSARAIVGNSSAGLIEAAALRTPAVNIGPRQAGRDKPRSVIDCDYGRANVRAALIRALSLNLKSFRHPYGPGRAGERIAQTLATVDLDAAPIRKRNRY